MENATKALLMAAVILISVIILSIAVYLFTYFGSFAKGVEDEVRTNQISEFNSQFLSYQNKDLTIHDVITLANLAKDYNSKNGYENSGTLGYIDVEVNIPVLSNFIGEDKDNNISEIDAEYIGNEVEKKYELKKYHCTVTVNDTTKFVEKITINEKN